MNINHSHSNTRSIFWLALVSMLLFSVQGCAQEKQMNTTDNMRDVKASNETPMQSETIVIGMGCFWGAEKRMESIPGVTHTEVGYAGGDAKQAGYYDVLGLEKEIAMGKSHARNHAEVVKVTFNPQMVSLKTVLIKFWESHDPTQGNRQGNDVGTNYRSVIYTTEPGQAKVAEETEAVYQKALTKAGYGKITTEIAPLRNYIKAEDYHQDYLKKNPNGYCGLGGTGVAYPGSTNKPAGHPRLDPANLHQDRQIIVFEAEDCPYCKLFTKEILTGWKADVPIVTTLNPNPPKGWTLAKPLFATPTIVFFEKGKEVSRYTGYSGDKDRFWKWLGFRLLNPEQRKIAFDKGTEWAFSGSHLDEHRPGTYVDPITGAALFRSDTKFNSGSGWPSFFNPVKGAVEERPDNSHGMRRTEVISASSGIHLGHVFDDGPAPTHKRYCINGNVLKFIPDDEQKK